MRNNVIMTHKIPPWVETFYITVASPWLHACQYIALTYMYYGIQSNFKDHDRVRMHVHMHLAFKELKYGNIIVCW